MRILRNHLDSDDMEMIILWSFSYFLFNVSFGLNPVGDILGTSVGNAFMKAIVIMLFLTFAMIMLDIFLFAWGNVSENLKEKVDNPLEQYERYDPPTKDLREVVGKIQVQRTMETENRITKFVETENGVETYVKEK